MDAEKERWVRGLLERFEGPLLLYAGRLLGDPHGAQDAVQEVFVRLLAQDRAAVEPRCPAWLYAVCRNLCMDRRRREKVMERTNAAALDHHHGPGGDPADLAAAGDAAAAALAALGHLPDRQREALSLRFLHGLSYREMAEVMDITVSHAGVLLHEGLKALRTRMGAVGPAAAAAVLAPLSRGAAR